MTLSESQPAEALGRLANWRQDAQSYPDEECLESEGAHAAAVTELRTADPHTVVQLLRSCNDSRG